MYTGNCLRLYLTVFTCSLVWCQSSSAEAFAQIGTNSPYYCVYSPDGSTRLTHFNGSLYAPSRFLVAEKDNKKLVFKLRKSVKSLQQKLLKASTKRRRTSIKNSIAQTRSKIVGLTTDNFMIQSCKNKAPLTLSPALVAAEFKFIPYNDLNGMTLYYGGAFIARQSLRVAMKNGKEVVFGDGSAWCVSALGSFTDGSTFFDMPADKEVLVVFASDVCKIYNRANNTCPNFFENGRIGFGVLTADDTTSADAEMNEVVQKMGSLKFLARPRPSSGCQG